MTRDTNKLKVDLDAGAEALFKNSQYYSSLHGWDCVPDDIQDKWRDRAKECLEAALGKKI